MFICIVHVFNKNKICIKYFQIPFFVIVDEKTNKIVIILRGSLSLRDVITDITADSAIFECEGVPPGAQVNIEVKHKRFFYLHLRKFIHYIY